MDTCPKVFVVDSQVSHITIPSARKPRWAKEGWKYLLLLVGLSMLGIVIEGCLIYNLYQKTEASKLCESPLLCHNLSNASASGEKESGSSSKQVGSKESNEISPLHTQRQERPFAHLLGSSLDNGEGNVVQWQQAGESVIQRMTYNDNVGLIVQQPGYYYLYSKLQLQFSHEDCTLIQHKVMRNTSAYGAPLELMKSKSTHCNRRAQQKLDLWSSFLAGIFQLQEGDRIYVTLDKIQEMRRGHTENFMGAFLISP